MSDPYVSSLGHPASSFVAQQKVIATLASTSPQQLTPTKLSYRAATLSGVKAAPNTPNSGDIYIGFDSTHQPIKLPAGTSMSIAAGAGGMPMDLSGIWISGTAGDGLVVNYQ